MSNRRVSRLPNQMGLSMQPVPSALSDNDLTGQARRITIKDLDPEKVPKFDEDLIWKL
jgi:hypothetical protein